MPDRKHVMILTSRKKVRNCQTRDKTGGAKKGLVKIASITTGAGGSMDIVVKVQQ